MLLRRLVVFFFCVFFFCVLPKPAHASNFTTDYHVIYSIDNQGVAHAQVNGSLTNTTSQYYATSYKIQLGFDTITNVKEQNKEGQITPVVIKNKERWEERRE